MNQKRNFLRQHLHNFRQSLSIYQHYGRAVQLVWRTDRCLTITMALLTLIAGLFPGFIAYVGKLIVDSVVLATRSGLVSDRWTALGYLGLEIGSVVVQTGVKQALSLCQSLLQMLLTQKVKVLILEKALSLDLPHFEDSEFYDKMIRARGEASSRPLNLVRRSFGLLQDTLSLITYSGLLLQFSVWAVAILGLAAIPAFVVESRFAGEAFQMTRKQAPEAREQNYLEWLMSQEGAAMEIRLFQLGPMLLQRYCKIFDRLHERNRNLTIQRNLWSYGLGTLSTLAFYGVYVWIVLEAIVGRISLGDLTMYLVVFRQGQSTGSSILSAINGLYEDGLYLNNLYEFLDQKIPHPLGYATRGLIPNDGLRFERVNFTYPGSSEPAIRNISLHLRPGQKLAIVGENGSGKTTLIKLLTRLYTPDSGKILLDGLDLQLWNIEALHRRIGVIFQNFVRYDFTVGENIGTGDVDYLKDEERWQSAAEKSTADAVIAGLPDQYHTRLGRLFKDGRELSGGQWQKVALSRVFMRSQADILVLDEPTSAMDAEAEVRIFDRFRAMTHNQMAIFISHRFSTVRMADQIIVLDNGEVLEQGTHEELLRMNGRYARLFSLQAAGYR